MAEIKNTKAFYNTEIPGDWEIIQLGDVVTEMKSGLSRELSNEDIGLPVIRSNNLINNIVDYSDIKYWYTVDNQGANTENYFLSEGDILVNFINSISQIGKCAYFKNIFKRPIIFTTNLMVIRFNNSRIDSRFYLYYTLSNHYQKFVDSITKPAINQASFTTKDYKKLLIPLPVIHEQRAIAQVLSTADAAIRTSEKLIAQKELRKKWLMQQLLSGKKRLKEFGGEWKEHSYEKILKVVKRNFDWDENELYKLISVRRRSGGIFYREALYGHQILVKTLRTANEGDFLFSKMQILHGASALVTKEFDGAKISGSYIAVVPKDMKQLSMEFFQWYSQIPYFYHQTYISSYGVHIEKMTFDFDTFLQLEMKLPTIEEQTAIAKVLQAADKEISLLKVKTEKLREQKKGLMQVLLTGKVRIK